MQLRTDGYRVPVAASVPALLSIAICPALKRIKIFGYRKMG